MAVFHTQRRVGWADADYAGIIFYPRYFEMLNSVIDEWFETAIGASFAGLIDAYQVGAPMGEIQARFDGACRLGDVLDFELSVVRLSSKTVTIASTASVSGETRIRTNATHICAHTDISGAAPWPPGLVEKMKHYRNEEAA